MAPVPPQVRQVDSHGDGYCGAQRPQMTALAWHHQDKAQGRDQPIGHRIFGKQSEAGRYPGDQPPAPAARLARPDEGIERRRPAWHQGRIGRDDEGRQRHARQRRIGQRRPEADAPIVQPRPDRIDEAGGGGMQQRRRQTDGKFAVAENGRGQRDQPGDKRRLRVIPERQMLRPRPVLRLVRVKPGRLHPQPQQPGGRDRRHRGQRPPAIGGAARGNAGRDGG